MLELMAVFAIDVISAIGYLGVFLLMVMESMVIPIPSELILPFAGFLISRGDFTFTSVIIAGSLGSIVGSLISYYMGKYGGNAFVIKYGKYVLLDVEDLKKAERWFEKRGEYTIFISRFIPVVRHLISIPAGIGKMDIKRFCLYTIVGASMWNFILVYAGYLLGEHWDKIKHYSEPVSLSVAAVLVIAFVWFVYRHLRDKLAARR
ncbi:MAG: DedA family protein [Deltaproteobacteria bacterium]|nr:DedA family protein [Candidatus Zymogenaceae bacterium]